MANSGKRTSRKQAAAMGVAVLCLGGTSWGQTVWNAGTDDWFNGANWSAGTPAASVNAEINNGGTAQIMSGSAAAGELILGFSTGDSGSLLFSGDQLATGPAEIVGDAGTGTFVQTGGSNLSLHLYLGYASGANGTYTLSGAGTLGDEGTILNAGLNGAGVFNQSNGTVTCDDLYLGFSSTASGTYNLSGGTLMCGAKENLQYNTNFYQTGGTNTYFAVLGRPLPVLFVYGSASYVMSGGILSMPLEEIIPGGTGTFVQSAGSNSTTFLAVEASSGTGSYTLAGGVLNVNGTQTSPAQQTGEFIGVQQAGLPGTSTFIQTGGTNTTTTLTIGQSAGATASYSLSGGLLTTPTENIGFGGPGNFTQTGGTNSFTSLSLGNNSGATGTFVLSGGTASGSSTLSVGGSSTAAGGTGVLTICGNGILNITGALIAYNTAGTSINLSGGTLNIGGLDVNGVPSLFNWSSGTLNFTKSVTFDSKAAPSGTGAAFGSSLVIGPNQTLLVSGVEAIGNNGPFTLTVNAGRTHSVTTALSVTAKGTLTLNGGAVTVGALNISQGGVVNMNGSLVIDYGSRSDPVNSIRADLAASYAAKYSAGSGLAIISSTAAAAPAVYALGYIDNTTTKELNIALTVPGDTDLSGTTDFNDLTTVAQFFGTSIAKGNTVGWQTGDVNYDGSVDFNDLTIVAQYFGDSLSKAEAASLPASFVAQYDLALAEVHQTSSVPEPAGLTLIALGMGLLRQRRGRQNSRQA